MTNERRFYVYAYFRKDGTPYYIGKGTGKRIADGHGRPAAMPPRDRRKILVDGLTEPDAFEYEVALIHCLGRKDLGTGCLHNKTDGGEGAAGAVLSPERKAKLIAANKGRTKSAKTKAKISEARKGSTHTPKTRAKLRASLTGRRLGPEHRAKVARQLSSPEHRAKISEANRKRVISQETRNKLSAANRARHAARRAAPGQLALNI